MTRIIAGFLIYNLVFFSAIAQEKIPYDVYYKDNSKAEVSWLQRMVNYYPWIQSILGESFSFERNIAVVIGIGNYDHLTKLASPENDAILVRDFLINKSKFDEVYTLIDEEVTLSSLNELMMFILPKRITPNDRFFFYWSGHGGRGIDLSGRPYGFLPLKDGRLNGSGSVIYMDVIQRWLRGIRPRHALFVFDACYSGNIFEGYALSGTIKEARLERLSRPAYEALSSSASNQQSYGYIDGSGGVFTKAFLEAASGEADVSPHDGFVTSSEIAQMVQQKLENFAAGTGNIYDYTMSVTRGKVATSGGEFFFLTPSGPPNTEQQIIVDNNKPTQSLSLLTSKNDCSHASRALDDFNKRPSCKSAQAFIERFGSQDCYAVDIIRSEEQQFCVNDLLDSNIKSIAVESFTNSNSDAHKLFNISPSNWEDGIPGKDLSLFKECIECPTMIVIPSGVSKYPFEGKSDVKVNTFALSETEVTVKNFIDFSSQENYITNTRCGKNKEYTWSNIYQTLSEPVRCVDGKDIESYISYINKKTATEKYRLPDIYEWQLAARSGEEIQSYFTNSGDICDYGNLNMMCPHQKMGISNVKSYKRNEYGLYDMLGNVAERTACNSSSSNVDCSEEYHLTTGGMWNYPDEIEGLPRRIVTHKDSGSASLEFGFRLARGL